MTAPASAHKGRDPLEGIDFYLRSPEVPTRYGLWARLADHWAGCRDARSLSTAQAAEHTTTDPLPALTPWANAVLSRAGQVAAKERTVLEAVLDPARQETTRLAHAATAAEADAETADADAIAADTEAAQADADAEAAQAAGPASADPVSAAEAYDSLEVRKGRRAKDHLALVGSHRARAAAARAQAKAARDRAAASRKAAATAREQAAVLATRSENAASVLATRLLEHADHTRRRLNTYSRQIARAHPDAAIIPALDHTPATAPPAATGPRPGPDDGPPRLHAL